MSSHASSASYLTILRAPRVAVVFASAVIGRLAYPFVSLPMLFAIQLSVGSYSAAGVATGLYGAMAGFLAPIRSRVVDRYGPRRVLPALSIAFAISLLTLAAATALNGGVAMCVALAGLSGVFAPPLGPVMRVVWSTLAPTDVILKKALGLDAVVEELLYLAGPALSGALLLLMTPSALLIVPAVLVVVGTGLMVSAPATSESYRHPRPSTARFRASKPLAARALTAFLLPVSAAGLIVGTIYVAIPATLGGAGSGGTVGVLLAIFACGSAAGGLVFGSLTVRGSPRVQLLGLTTLLSVGSIVMAVAASPVGLGVILALSGLFLSPTMIVAYFAASNAKDTGRSTEATTWVNTSHNIGASAGTLGAGFAVDGLGAGAALIIAGIGALVLIALSAAAGAGAIHGS